MPLTDMRGIKGWVESISLTNMRIKNGWVESFGSLPSSAGDFFIGSSFMVEHGFYIVKDSFFDLASDPFLKNNKDGNRPFYYCIKECIDDKIFYWMIPLSSRVEKYQEIIAKKEAAHKPCHGLYICKLPNDKLSAFLIQDIFPISEEYIDREYTLGGNHLILPYDKDISEIEKKAKHVIRLVRKGIKLTPTSPDIISVLEKLTK